jgi:glycerol-3-phosphate dehydrogenase
MQHLQKIDILISGGGVTGLWLALKLSLTGYFVVVLEKGRYLAG